MKDGDGLVFKRDGVMIPAPSFNGGPVRGWRIRSTVAGTFPQKCLAPFLTGSGVGGGFQMVTIPRN